MSTFRDPSVAFIGEPLLEMAPLGENRFRLGVAGDVLNCAIALAQCGAQAFLATATGSDENSLRIEQTANSFAVDTSLLVRDANHQSGLYMISNDAEGERSFTYWRNDSAARHLFSNKKSLLALLQKLDAMGGVYLSGISLAIMAPACRSLLLSWLKDYKSSGGVIIFDTNYRASLWSSAGEFREASEAIIETSSIFLPSMEDLLEVYQGRNADDIIAILRQQPVPEIVISNGASSVRAIHESDGMKAELLFDVAEVEHIVDTTGAGDAFNGAYLAARISGADIKKSIAAGVYLSSLVIGHQGALLPENTWPAVREQLGLHPIHEQLECR
jgi:2-dehydro-3-deoxygluconokinase